ncbi:MAG: OmpH family outer membrane protein [Candidatus Cryptobacteroides sp.]
MKRILTICAAVFVAASAFAQQKTGYVNTTELIQLQPAMDTVRTQLESAQKETYETYQAMLEEYQTKATTYQQKQASWTTAIRESKQKELNEIGNRIQEFEQTANQDLQQMQQMLQAPIYQKVNEEIQSLAKAKGLAFVFDIASVLYIDPAQSIDLTPELRTILGIPEGRTLQALQEELQAKAAAQQQ